MAGTFRALVLEEGDDGVAASVQTLEEDRLPEGDVTVAVSHSTLNYKDGMVLKGIGRLVREYPHVPGIDFAGAVESSDSSEYKPGEEVILTGWRVGEVHWGGYAEKARVNSDWLVPMPKGMTPEKAMIIGTAGFTAMLCVMALEDHGITPESGPVLVTGGNGGVGGVAISLMNAAGYEVHASTGRKELAERLTGLGAREIIDRSDLDGEAERPLQAERWAGCVDAVGGNTLATILTHIKYGGAVASCGLAGGNKLNTTVIPFLLRGVSLLGIDSVMCPVGRRRTAWERLATELPDSAFEALVETVGLGDLPDLADAILKGQTTGRIVVDVTR